MEGGNVFYKLAMLLSFVLLYGLVAYGCQIGAVEDARKMHWSR